MAINANASLTFTSYEVVDDGTRLNFVCANPGPGLPSDYVVLLTDAEIAGTTTNAQLKTLVTTKLSRKLRATGLASKLDALLGQAVTV